MQIVGGNEDINGWKMLRTTFYVWFSHMRQILKQSKILQNLELKTVSVCRDLDGIILTRQKKMKTNRFTLVGINT